VESESQAETAVKADRETGYDAVKVYGRLTLTAYEALVSPAHKLGLPVYGHVPAAVGLSNALRLRQDSIEHADGYIAAIQADASPYARKPGTASQMVEYVEMSSCPRSSKQRERLELGTVLLSLWRSGPLQRALIRVRQGL
jgi:hypothetical protein